MKIIVIAAHPNSESFNIAIADKAVETLESFGYNVIYHDLYRENFNPLIPVQELSKNHELCESIKSYCDELKEADGLVFIHPNWWGQPPAILKGWIDRVFRPGVAYEFVDGDGGQGIPIGLLKGKKALVLNTSDTPDDREAEIFGDPLENIWKKCIFEFCGITDYFRWTFNIIAVSTPEIRGMWLSEVKNIIKKFFAR